MAEPLIEPVLTLPLSPETALPAYEVNAHFVHGGPGFGRRIALTFDDGPRPGTTEIVLAELAKRNLKATFFIIGANAKLYPDLVKAVHEGGHEVANHSYTHPQLSKLSNEKVKQELERTQEAIYNSCGVLPVWFRPPYGAFRVNQGPIPRAMDLGVAYWSVDPLDWKKPGVATITSRVLSQTRPGSIVLMHDIHQQTATAVPAIFDGLLEKNYVMTSMSGFLGHPYPAGDVVES